MDSDPFFFLETRRSRVKNHGIHARATSCGGCGGGSGPRSSSRRSSNRSAASGFCSIWRKPELTVVFMCLALLPWNFLIRVKASRCQTLRSSRRLGKLDSCRTNSCPFLPQETFFFRYHTMEGVVRATKKELTAIKGLSEAKVEKIKAAGKRYVICDSMPLWMHDFISIY